MMKRLIKTFIKRLSSKLLFFVLEEVLTMLQSRQDNSLNHDANKIKRILKNNSVYVYGDQSTLRHK